MPRRIVLFDFDGVLVRGDAFVLFLIDLILRQCWRLLPLLLFLPVVAVACMPRRGRRAALRSVVRVALLGMSDARYRVRAERFGRRLAGDAARISSAAVAAVRSHVHAGDRVIVVTGCEGRLAVAILDALGLGAIEVIGSELAQARFGLRVAMRNHGVEKVRQLAIRGVVPPWDVAISDSLNDMPILAAARSAILVNPRRAAMATARAQLGRSVSSVDWT
jgi:phosphatidylglycerophosphatase C